jgi:hypothetical protein
LHLKNLPVVRFLSLMKKKKNRAGNLIIPNIVNHNLQAKKCNPEIFI